MANGITLIRILCAAALLFCPAFSPAFYGLYLAAGLSDMLDGAVARRTRAASAFGAKLDTAADFALVAVCLVKLLPALHIAAYLYVWTAIVALIKTGVAVFGFVRQRRLVAVHTPLNKAVGGALFLLPLTPRFIDVAYSAPAVCALATVAAVREGYDILRGGTVP